MEKNKLNKLSNEYQNSTFKYLNSISRYENSTYKYSNSTYACLSLVIILLVGLIMFSSGVQARGLVVNNISNPSQTPYFFVNGTNGNVGIGTTTLTSSKFQILETGSGFTHEKSAAGYFYSSGFNGNNPYLTYYASTGMTIGYGSSTGAAPSVNTLTLLNGGNVGIGTASPNDKLEVAGALNLQGSNSGAVVPALGTNAGRFKFLNGNVYGLLGDVLTNGDTYLQSGRIDSSASAYNILLNPLGGNVGIGNTAPAYKLDVNGVINASGILINGSAMAFYNSSYVPYTGATANVDLGAKNLTTTGIIYNTFGKALKQGNSATIASDGWYRIAQSSGDRASGLFNVMDETGSRHQSVYFYAGVAFPGNDESTRTTFNLISNVRYSTNTFSKSRIVRNASSLYSPVYLEIYVENAASNTVKYTLSENDWVNGWTPVSWTAGSIPTDYVATEYLITNLDFNSKNNFVLTNGGYTGIGTVTPGVKLEINQSSAGTGFRVSNSSGTQQVDIDVGTYPLIGTNTNDPFYIQTNNAIVTTFLTNGNVGIGNTAPNSKLDVNGLINASGILINGSAMAIYNSSYLDTSANGQTKTGSLTLGGLAMGTNRITGVGNPSGAQDAATKAYVDASNTSLSGSYVPYTGATANVDLGNNNLTVNNLTATGHFVLGGLYSSAQQSISISLGTEAWIKLATIGNNDDVRFKIRTGSTNSEEVAEIKVFGTYYLDTNGGTGIEVTRQSYNPHLKEVIVTGSDGGAKSVYIRIRSSENAPTVTWRVLEARNAFTINNIEETPGSGQSLNISGNRVRYSNLQLHIGDTIIAGNEPTYRGNLIIDSGLSDPSTNGIEFKSSAAGSGFGHRLATIYDGASNVDFSIQSRQSSASWTRVFNIQGSTGNIGIGTTAPAAKLEVIGTANITGGAASVKGLYVESSGEVGIGTTEPSQKLHINGGTIRADLGATGTSFILTGTGSNLQVSHDGGANVALFNSGGGIQFRDTDGTTNLVTLLTGGKLGIGNTAPAYKLDVNGVINASGILINGSAMAIYNSSYLDTSANAQTKTGALTVSTLNTGQGNYELYSMDQNVLTSSSPTFAGVIATTYASIGSTVASAGALRLANAGKITARNNANNADKTLMWLSASDKISIGEDGASGSDVEIYGGNLTVNNRVGIGNGRTAQNATLDVNGSFAAISYNGGGGNYIVGSKSYMIGTLDSGGTIESSGSGSFAQGYLTVTQARILASNKGSFAQGIADTGNISAIGEGSFARGKAYVGNISARSAGSFAGGYVDSGGNIISSGSGAIAHGMALLGAITASGEGSFADGYNYYGNTTSSGHGSFAQGAAWDGNIVSSNRGAFAQGYAYPGTITASGLGAFAQGYSANGAITASGSGSVAIGDNIVSSNTLSTAFGKGFTNSIANSFQVGYTSTPTLFVNGTNVGIGITTPAERLEVGLGNISLSGTNALTTTQGILKFYNPSYSTAWAGIEGKTNSAGLNQMDLIFYTSYGSTSEKMRLLSNSGNLGIGTTNPTAKSEVVGTFNATGGGPSVKGLYVDGTGQVGIGTTAPAGIIETINSAGGLPANSGSAQTSALNLRLRDGNEVMDIGGTAGSGYWIQVTNKLNLATNYALMLNPNGGNVGIGTTAPTAKLEVAGTTQDVVNISSSAISAGIVLTPTSGTEPWKIYAAGAGLFMSNSYGNFFSMDNLGHLGLGVPGNTNYFLEIANSNKALNVSGFLYANSTKVGIGTALPTSALEVNGNITVNNTVFSAPGKDLILNGSSGNVIIQLG